MRPIDADALIKTMNENAEGNWGWYGDTWQFMRDVENAPTIDAVPVVRCKDCRWFGKIGCAIEVVDETDMPKENDFCSFAERKDDEEVSE